MPTPEETKVRLQRIAALNAIFDEVRAELESAMTAYPTPFNSAHEGHSIIREELEKELWEHVCVKQGSRNIPRMRHEAVQVAAMAIRFIHDICNDDRGQR